MPRKYSDLNSVMQIARALNGMGKVAIRDAECRRKELEEKEVITKNKVCKLR